jgi:hypothetical protein
MEHAVKLLMAAKFDETDELARLRGTLDFHRSVQAKRAIIRTFESAIAGKEAKLADYEQALAILSEHTGELPVMSSKDEEALVDLLTGAIPVVKVA